MPKYSTGASRAFGLRSAPIKLRNGLIALGDPTIEEQAAAAAAEAKSVQAALDAAKKRRRPELLENYCGGTRLELMIVDRLDGTQVSKVPEWWNDRAKGLFLPPGYKVRLFEDYDNGGAGKNMVFENYSNQDQCIDLVAAGMTKSANWGSVSAYDAIDIRMQDLTRLADEKEKIANSLQREADAQQKILAATQSVVATAGPTLQAQQAKGQVDVAFWQQQAQIEAQKTLAEQQAIRQQLANQISQEEQAAGTGTGGSGWTLAAVGAAAAALLAIVVVAARRRRR